MARASFGLGLYDPCRPATFRLQLAGLSIAAQLIVLGECSRTIRT